jgi:hypothetical protein
VCGVPLSQASHVTDAISPGAPRYTRTSKMLQLYTGPCVLLLCCVRGRVDDVCPLYTGVFSVYGRLSGVELQIEDSSPGAHPPPPRAAFGCSRCDGRVWPRRTRHTALKCVVLRVLIHPVQTNRDHRMGWARRRHTGAAQPAVLSGSTRLPLCIRGRGSPASSGLLKQTHSRLAAPRTAVGSGSD